MGKVGTEATLLEIKGLTDDIRTFTEVIAQGATIDSLLGFKKLVRDGKAQALLPVGTQLFDKWAKAAGTEYNAPWDIVHYDAAGNAYLNWHFCYPDGVQFDAPEAIYYAGPDGLPAGQYYIQIGSAWGQGWASTKAINFTLTADMAAGDQLYIDCGTSNNNDPTSGRTWNVYAQGSTTSKQTGTTSEGTTGTLLGTIGATNIHKPEGNINGISRVVYGYGRWSQSAVRQWLNSTLAANKWWTPQNPWDRPPGQHSTLRGFLAGYSEEFVAALDTVDVVTALDTVEGLTDTTETTQDRIFLPSLQEMYINPELADVEGVDWDYNKALAAEAGLDGKFQRSQTYPILKKYIISDQSSAAYVWLRSCYRGNAGNAWYVTNSGYVNYYLTASSALRGCPACKILKNASS